MADRQFGDLLAAVGVAHGGDELADLDVAAGLGDGVHAGFEPGLHGLDDVVQAQALLQVLFGRPAHLAVHDAVVGQVFDEFLRDAEQAFLGLHHGDGVVEGLQVADQRAGVGGFAEPLPQRDGVRGGQRVADGLGKFNDGGRAESAVQVVVKGNLGKALQVEVEVRGSVRNSLSHVPTIGSPGAGSYFPDAPASADPDRRASVPGQPAARSPDVGSAVEPFVSDGTGRASWRPRRLCHQRRRWSMRTPSTMANTTAMPALSSGLWCSHGKELARTPMPIE